MTTETLNIALIHAITPTFHMKDGTTIPRSTELEGWTFESGMLVAADEAGTAYFAPIEEIAYVTTPATKKIYRDYLGDED